MLRFRRMHALKMFASVHGSVQNQFQADRSLSSRDTYKAARTAAPAEWRQLCAGQDLAARRELRRVRI
jgi:putative transposase